MNAGDVYNLLITVAPVDNIVIGDASKKETWEVVYSAQATPQQQSAAQQLIDQINPNVPSFVSSVQARLALTAAGKRDQVEAAVNAASITVQDYWHYAGTIERYHPIILQMAAGLGWTSADLDALFIAAAVIT